MILSRGSSTHGRTAVRAISIYDAKENCERPTTYRQLDADRRGRSLYQIVTICHPHVGQLVNAINYSPDATFERTDTGCRCLTLTVSFVAPPASRDSPSDVTKADAAAARIKVAAELKASAAKAAIQAAEAAAAELLAEEEVETAAGQEQEE
jgi:hypothetical protein